MPISPGFREFVLDQLSGVRGLRTKPMFGCIGLYSGDVFFGIVADDVSSSASAAGRSSSPASGR